ncbi:hypothetical protein [uncultured Jannaschia sp.]|uniref:hypothetical protein n=1 Tax=uncultured Jannaschia sp. TaxID=293347 RepID=UPI002635BF38|nr:hypothetical protein [uncultured Jannaschia sp.]
MVTMSLELYGTMDLPTPLEWFDVGDWRFALGNGDVRYLSYRGQEVVRAIAFLARDANWGVHAMTVGKPRVLQEASSLQIEWSTKIYSEDAPKMLCDFRVKATGRSVSLSMDGAVHAPLISARTGFVLLHPIIGFSGRQLEVRGTGETALSGTVPVKVSPCQPFKDIRGLDFDLEGEKTRIEIDLAGEHPFEMEDQRNWTDASFKTYYRPLALDRPYSLTPGERLSQSITVRARALEESAPNAIVSKPQALELTGPAPMLGLVWLDDEDAPTDIATLRMLGLHRLTAQIDLRRDDPLVRVRAAADLAGDISLPLHLRLVLPDEGDQSELLHAIANEAGPVESVHALPAAFLTSYQPEGPWPTGLSCAEAVQAVRRFFPQARTIEGVLTFFTELNRYPPRAGGDTVSFGTSAIVHAADDRSVMETLEALPSVFETAKALAGDRPMEVGLASIALWTNPYGEALVANPKWERRPMTNRDPRLRALFGAAWLLGYLAHAIQAGVGAVGVGTLNGPMGLLPSAVEGEAWLQAFHDARLRPIAHVAKAVAALQGPLAATAPMSAGDLAVVRAGDRALLANTGPEPLVVDRVERRIMAARILDAESLNDALKDPEWLSCNPALVTEPLALPGYAIALVELERP